LHSGISLRIRITSVAPIRGGAGVDLLMLSRKLKRYKPKPIHKDTRRRAKTRKWPRQYPS
jgi:hypothetical protein